MQGDGANCHIKRCVSSLNKTFDETQKDLDDFMDKSLKWCGDMKSLLQNEIAKAKCSQKKRGCKNAVVPQKENSSHINNVTQNESMACRTRLALKTSVLISENVTVTQTEGIQTRARSRIRKTADQGALGIDLVAPKKDESDVFKKPKPRGKKTKAKKSVLEKETVIEEVISFNAVLHSSPNVNTENSFLCPKNISAIPQSPRMFQARATNKSPKEVADTPTAVPSTLNDFINDIQTSTPKMSRRITGEVDSCHGGSNEAVDSYESKLAAVTENPRNSKTQPERVVRETRSVKAAQQVEPVCVKPEPKTPEASSPLRELNTTKVVAKATNRTKPVLKSRIFDNEGNFLASVNSEKNSVKDNSPGKPYALRSSSSTRENLIKNEMVTPEIIDTGKATEAKESCERRSNAENEPEVKRTKKTKRTKAKETEKVSDDGGRITRTKSKEAKKALEEAAPRKSIVQELARKSLKRAKLIALQKSETKTGQNMAAILAYQARQVSVSKAPPTASKNELLASSNKLSTLAKESVNLGSHAKPSKYQCFKSGGTLMSTEKGKYLSVYTDTKGKFITPGKRCHSPDVGMPSTSKMAKEDEIEKELKLKALKEKEEEAQMKREMAIKMRQKELKEKTTMKLESAMKQRKKLEMEKYNNKVQLEKEKEEKRKLILREREMMMKEKARMKRALMEQKLAETEERRRMEEEARIAKLKEQEAEQQRIMLEKQKELERHEKRAQERLAEQKARENYEMKLKTEQMLREKQQQLAAQSANKAAMLKGNQVKQWNYKSRNENDRGLDDEESDLDSEDEGSKMKTSRPTPKWAQDVTNNECRVKCLIKEEAMREYMRCHQKTPDIHKMFKMTPNKRIKRTSSAIWNTPSS